MAHESLHYYADTGGLYEDASILRNAVYFTTAQRAFSASLILAQPLDHLDSRLLAFLAVEAFCAEMTATEDVLGWIFVLKDWAPGDPSKCLLRQLDKVNVGPNEEKHALQLLDQLDPDGLRELLHIPTDAHPAAASLPINIRDRINTAIPAILQGLKRVAWLRKRDDRGYVVAFNKLKHQLLALHTGVRGRNEVLVPKWLGMKEDGIHLRNAWIESSPKNIRLMASRAIGMQAVLNSILGLILLIRFGHQYESPHWTIAALDLPGWYEGSDNADG